MNIYNSLIQKRSRHSGQQDGKVVEWLVEVVAPQNAMNFVWKFASLTVFIAVLDMARETLLSGQDRESIFENLFEAFVVGGPFITLGLWLIWHLDTLQKELRRIALTDQLTNLPNRRAFFEVFESTLPPPENTILLLFDIDRFKSVNDNFGHAVGDQCIIDFGKLAKSLLVQDDFVARIGGEEFLVILADPSDGRVKEVAQRLACGIILSVPAVGVDKKITCSVGITASVPREKSELALRRADDALYEAKEAGRARFIDARQKVLEAS